jgi:hypothetical protein
LLPKLTESINCDDGMTAAHAAMMPAARPEIELLICLARPTLDVTTAEQVRRLLQPGLDWQYLLSLAHRHGLVPLLHYHLNRLDSLTVPKQAMSQLQDDNHENARSSLFLTGELLKLIDMFEERGVRTIPFKGPTLALWAYGDVGLRQFADLDILVQKQDLPRVKDLLINEGFKPTPELTKAQEAALLRFDSACNFDNGCGVILDLHWDFVPRHFSFDFDATQLWDRLEPITIGRKQLLTLSPEDLLLVLCLHGFTHLWERLGWICDVAALIDSRKDIDWELVLQNAARLGCRRVLSLGLLLASELLGAAVPEEVWNNLPREPTVRKLAAEIQDQLFAPGTGSRGFVERILLQVRMRERRRDRFWTCIHLAATPRVYDWMLVPLPDSLFVLYYLLRPLRLAGKYGAKLLKGTQV